MNNLKKLFIALSFIFILASCTEDETVNDSCFTCENTQTEYCYTIGNSYYLTTNSDGTSFETELNGATWSDTLDYIESQCNGTTPNTDCYTCESTSTEFCYTNGDDFYTVTVNGNNPQDIPLNNISWSTLRSGFEEACGGSETTSIVGTWNLTDFHGTSTNVVSFNDNTLPQITTITTQTLVSGDVVVTFNQDNTYNATGSLEIRSVTTTDGNTTGDFNYTSTPFDTGDWSTSGDQITIDTSTGESSTGTIINQTDNEFTIKSIIHSSQDNAAGNSTTDGEFYQTFTRQ